ncbi:hypothetical protein TSUD_238060 [Trifolium subterraneum]|uniref:Serine hydrolase domain-containing protein n=1 Tax=Trifolium subterraneum TaxID=3900 RepID=A0A2Z6NRS4_TRISU|nr:hypothetical protein TSUD_238060 [Trifolium subterraneum]
MMENEKKLKILCLHGYRTSGQILKKSIVLRWPESDFTQYRNFEECIAYIEDYMLKNGPFHGVLGFSQGAVLAAALPGMQAQRVALQKISKIKFLILISGAKFGSTNYGTPKLASNAFSKPIDCPSLHIIGEMDYLKPESIILLEAFVNPVVIHHPKGHEIPRLDEKSLATLLGFIDTIQRMLSYDHCRL